MKIRKEQDNLLTSYVASKYYSSTGAVIEARGDTPLAARENLKQECLKYRQKPLKPKKDADGNDVTIASPGYESVQNGLSVQRIYNPNRRAQVLEAND